MGNGIARLAGFTVVNKVMDSIEECHFHLKPPAADGPFYLNRKLLLSVQFQAVCNHTVKCLYEFVGFPESENRVKNTPIYHQRLYPRVVQAMDAISGTKKKRDRMAAMYYAQALYFGF